MAAGSQALKGICALLVKALNKNRNINNSQSLNLYEKISKLLLPTINTKPKLVIKNLSPSRLVNKVNIPALKDLLLL